MNKTLSILAAAILFSLGIVICQNFSSGNRIGNIEKTQTVQGDAIPRFVEDKLGEIRMRINLHEERINALSRIGTREADAAMILQSAAVAAKLVKEAATEAADKVKQDKKP